MVEKRSRIGLIGFGYLGSYVYEQISTHPELGMDIAFVFDIDREKIEEIPANLVLENLSDFAQAAPDLIVELAHPSISRQYGERFLQSTNYLTFSVTAFADPTLEKNLPEVARKNATCLIIPHGAVVGLEAIHEGGEMWDEVVISMTKSPKNLDFSESSDYSADQIKEKTVLYDGPTRGICPQFPRNVNTHAALAMGSLGFDRTRSILIAEPGIDVSIIEIEARGKGVELKIERTNPMVGVSGTLTLYSAFASVCRAASPGRGMEIR
jgi:predicted dinucleotide-utilizing enzyme